MSQALLKNHGGGLPMGLQIRDDRQMKALTGLSQAQFDHLLPYFSTIYASTQQKTYVEGVAAGTRRRKLGGGSKGKLPTMAEKLQFVRDCSEDTGLPPTGVYHIVRVR